MNNPEKQIRKPKQKYNWVNVMKGKLISSTVILFQLSAPFNMSEKISF